MIWSKELSVFSIGDKVRHIETGTEWWVLTLYPELNNVVCITTDESRSTRITYKPDQLEILL